MLSIAILAFAVFFLTQLAKPVLKASILPQGRDWQNTALRGIVFLLAYILTLLNTLSVQRLDWSGAWGLLTTAGVVFALAVASYHVLDDNPVTPTPPPPSSAAAAPPAPPKRSATGRFTSAAPVTVSAPLQIPATTPPAAPEQPMVWKSPPEHLQSSGDMKQ